MSRLKLHYLAAAVAVLAAITADAASNANSCINESTGIGGYQFFNSCSETIKVYMRSGGGPTGGSHWGSLMIPPGHKKVVNSFSGDWVACPLERDGKEVTFNTTKKECAFR